MSGSSLIHKVLPILDQIIRENPQKSRFSTLKKVAGEPNPSSLVRMLRLLEDVDLIEFCGRDGYGVGKKLLEWTQILLPSPQIEWINLAKPSMVLLAQTFQSSTILWIRVNDWVMPLYKETYPTAPALMETGNLYPILICWMGAQFFLNAKPNDAYRLCQEMWSHGYCLNVDVQTVRRLLELGETLGYMDDEGKFYKGNYRLAVPIVYRQQVVATLGIGVWEGRIREEIGLKDQIIHQLKIEKDRIETKLAFHR